MELIVPSIVATLIFLVLTLLCWGISLWASGLPKKPGDTEAAEVIFCALGQATAFISLPCGGVSAVAVAKYFGSSLAAAGLSAAITVLVMFLLYLAVFGTIAHYAQERSNKRHRAKEAGRG